jgi:hypothetical protein
MYAKALEHCPSSTFIISGFYLLLLNVDEGQCSKAFAYI